MDKGIDDLKREFLKLKLEVVDHFNDINLKKDNYLHNYFYFISYPLFSFAESVIILCENGKNNSAKVLLRSLFEAHINIIYHQVEDSERRLALSAKKGFDTKIKNIKEIEDLIKKHPNLSSRESNNLFNETFLKEAKEWAKEKRAVILANSNIDENDEDLDLKSKAIKCDLKFVKNAEKGHFQKMYTIIYRTLSPASHLNIEGLNTFVSKDEAGCYLFDEGNDGLFLINQSIGICLAFTKDLYDLGFIEGKHTDTINKLENLLVQYN